MKFAMEISSAKLFEDRIVVSFDCSIGIYSLVEGSEIVKLSSVSKLLDITICESDNPMIFALDNEGWIYVEYLQGNQTNDIKMSNFIETFQDNRACSVFYSQTHSSLYVGYTDMRCSKVYVNPDSGLDNVCSEQQKPVEVFK